MIEPKTWASEEERLAVLAETVAAANENRLPFQENKPAGRVSEASSAPVPATPAGIFTEADLFSLAHRTQWVTMPGGRKLCVHTLSLEEVGWVNAQALDYVLRKGKLSDEERRTWYALAVKLYQTIACARVSEEPDAAPVFSAKNHEAIARNLGWSKIEQIGNLSDRLGLEGNEQELVTDFFGCVERFCSTTSALSTKSFPASCRRAMREFGSLATSVARRGYLLPSDVDGMAGVLAGLEG